MTPSARVQAAIECLDEILAGAPAEKTLTNWARRSRFAGSKDRAAVRDHVFDALRRRDSFARRGGVSEPLHSAIFAYAPSELSGRQIMLGLAAEQGLEIGALFSGQGHAPAPLTEGEEAVLAQSLRDDALWDMPAWAAELLERQYGERARDLAQRLSDRAPVDLRVNLAQATVDAALALLAEDEITAQPVALASGVLRITENARKLKSSAAYERGIVELQDAGSQALSETLARAVGLSAQMRVLDFCAGGGGKSLALAAYAPAQIFAHDISAARMRDIPGRAKRAGAQITVLAGQALAQQRPFDLVLCDVPCSGSGTWRRNPDEKWRFTRSDLEALQQVQASILSGAAAHVARGGYLALATCSLFEAENDAQVRSFLSKHSGFSESHRQGWTLFDGGDGLFLSILKKG